MGAVVKAAKNVVKATVKTVGKVVKAVAQNPIAVIAAVAAPPIGAAFGLSAPVAIAATNAAVTLATTGDLGKAIISGAAAGVGEVVGQAVGGSLVKDYGVTTAKIVGSAAKSATQTAIATGGDASAIFKGAIAGAAGSAAGQAVGTPGVYNALGDTAGQAVEKAAQNAAIAAVMGGDPGAAALMGAGGSLLSSATQGLGGDKTTAPAPATPPGLAALPAGQGAEQNIQYTAGTPPGAVTTAPSVEVTAPRLDLDLADTTPALLNLINQDKAKTATTPAAIQQSLAKDVVDKLKQSGGDGYVDAEGRVVVTAMAPELDLVSPGYVFDANLYDSSKAKPSSAGATTPSATTPSATKPSTEQAPAVDVTAKRETDTTAPAVDVTAKSGIDTAGGGTTTYFGPSEVSPQDAQILKLIGVTAPSSKGGASQVARAGAQAPTSSLISAEDADLSALFGGKPEELQDVWNQSSLRLRSALGI